ncbi:MAG: N-acetylmuramoyl-L-alanine amidase [Pelistega sp.]|nr:N-acetylmuramoyl-L-alanine amidase [Pelistega sp.]
MIKKCLGLLSVLLLSACASSIVDERYESKGQDSRVKYIIIHYTWEDMPNSLRILTEGEVSSHYLISDEEPARVLQLVDENQRAWHAGRSQWKMDTNLNANSIGIEIVNLGSRQSGQAVPAESSGWQPFTSSQIERLIVLLKDIQTRHRIPSENILGHSDIAPQRKVDPGPLFPWQWLAQEGLGRWYDEAQVMALKEQYRQQGLPSATVVQRQLQQIGYPITVSGEWDKPTKNVLRAFQMHYRPSRYDGVLDAQTAAIIRDLSQKEK